MTSRSTHALNYANPISHWRHRRRLYVLACVATMAVVAWLYGRPVATRLELLYWQRQCRIHAPSADMVVFEDDPARAAELLRSGGHYERYGPDVLLSPFVPLEPDLYGPFTVAYYRPKAYRHLFPSEAGGVAFMHARQSPAGNDRIVIVRLFFSSAVRSNYLLSIDRGVVVTPATLLNDIRVSKRHVSTYPLRQVEPNWFFEADGRQKFFPGLRLYAGQPDPQNLARFTIRYEHRELEWDQDGNMGLKRPESASAGVIQGVLRDDDTVEMRVLSGPLSSEHFDRFDSQY